jgi:hypothetical protein
VFLPSQEHEVFSTPKRPDRLWRQPLLSGYCKSISPGVKQLKHEADGVPPSSAEVKNDGSYVPTLPYAFMACTGANLPFAGSAAFG